MYKIFLSIIIFLIGLASGYYFIILAGYTASWSLDLLIISGKILKRYEMLYMLGSVMKIQSLITVVLAAIPVFLIYGLFLSYFIKKEIKYIKSLSSIGLVILPAWASGIPSIYDGMFFHGFIVLAIPLLINLFFINKLSSIVNTSEKSVEIVEN